MSAEPTEEASTDTETDPAADSEAETSPEIESEPSAEREKEPTVSASGVDDQGDSATAESETEPESPEAGSENDAEAETDSEAEEASEPEATGPPTVFRAAITGGEFKSLVKSLRAIVDEARVHISETGLEVRAIDPANVAMDDFELTSAAFESYEATPGTLGLNLERLESIVKMANKGDLIQFSFDAQTRKLLIAIDGVEFTTACLDPDTIRAEPELPDLELNAQATIEQGDLSRGVKAADMVSDHIAFEMSEADRCLAISAEGDTDDIRFTLEENDLTDTSFTDAISLFSLDYLKDITKTIPKGQEVSLRFGTDFPVMMEYDIADGDGHALRMIAPRIRSD